MNRFFHKGPFKPLSNAPSERSYDIQCLLNLNIQVFKSYTDIPLECFLEVLLTVRKQAYFKRKC